MILNKSFISTDQIARLNSFELINQVEGGKVVRYTGGNNLSLQGSEPALVGGT